MKSYKHIFFDLDHTLWDFETNSRETLSAIYDRFIQTLTDASCMDFIESYEQINYAMWVDYAAGKINKQELRSERFPRALKILGIKDLDLAAEINEIYLEETPYKTALFPHTREVLSYLGSKYDLHLITNGFYEIVQIKMTQSNLWSYFKEVIISEVVGHPKPSPVIFQEALKKAGAQKQESVFVGDNPVSDIGGARNFGMDQVFFNPAKNKHELDSTFEIHSLAELRDLF